MSGVNTYGEVYLGKPLPKLSKTDLTTTAFEQLMPDPPGEARCRAFLLHNTHATQYLRYAMGGDTAVNNANFPKLEPGKSILIPSGFDNRTGVSLIGEAAGTSYSITPFG